MIIYKTKDGVTQLNTEKLSVEETEDAEKTTHLLQAIDKLYHIMFS